ncbi:MAG: VWA domain-containing protein [Bryobacteraceae bacterium]
MRRVLIASLACAVWAQEAGFRVQTQLVMVPVSVTLGGQTVDGLEPQDFLVLDNGRPRKPDVDSFATGVAPIALVVAVQSSGISYPVLLKVRRIGAMIQPLITGERGCAGLVSFSQRVEWLEECTGSPEALSRAFARLRPVGDKTGRMLDAASEAIKKLEQRPRSRKVLLLVSETRDRGSETALEAVLHDAQRANVMVYAASYSAFTTAFTTKPSDTRQPKVTQGPGTPRNEPGSPAGRERIPIPPPEQRADILGGLGELVRLGKENAVQALTVGTGGMNYRFTRQKGLEEMIEKLGRELHTQYVLSFAPDSTSPGYHTLEVRVARKGEYRVRARPGYWASGQ